MLLELPLRFGTAFRLDVVSLEALRSRLLPRFGAVFPCDLVILELAGASFGDVEDCFDLM